MKILKIISEHKRIKGKLFFYVEGGELKSIYKPPVFPRKGLKRVEAVIDRFGYPETRHIDIQK